MPAYQRGFFCGDTSITYPYLEREAIPDGMLIAGGIIITGLTVRKVQKLCSGAAADLPLTLFPVCSWSDRAGRVLPSSLPRRALAGLRPKPLRVQPLQGAGQLPVWLLRWPVANQHGQAERGATPAQLPVRLQHHLRVHQVHVGKLRSLHSLPAVQPQAGGGGEVCRLTARHGSRPALTQLTPALSFSCRKSFFSGHASFAMYTMLYLAVSHLPVKHTHTCQLEQCFPT